MRRFRVSIAGSLAGIALLGVVLAALMSPSPLWGSLFYSVTAASLVISLLAIPYRKGARRAFWVGFATLGWAYHLAFYGPAPLSNVGVKLVTIAIFDILYPFTLPRPSLAPVASIIDSDGDGVPDAYLNQPPTDPSQTGVVWLPRNALEQSRATNWIPWTSGSQVIFTGASATTLPVPTAWEIWTTPDRATQFNQASPLQFRRIGQSVACLIVASLGGVLTRWFYRTRDEPE